MEPTPRKTSIRIWQPVLDRFNERINAACLRRDAWLTKVLDHELPHLEAEIRNPNSEAAQRFIASRLDALPRKLVTLTLPDELVRTLDDICQRKRIVRDSLFNRLFFLLVADFRLKTRLFFDGDNSWFPRLLERTNVSSSAAGDLLDAVPEFRDPFLAIREGQRVLRDELIKEFGTPERADEWFDERRIYTAPITETTFPKIDLSGLNVYLSDLNVPGTAEHGHLSTLLDDFLAEEKPAAAAKP